MMSKKVDFLLYMYYPIIAVFEINTMIKLPKKYSIHRAEGEVNFALRK